MAWNPSFNFKLRDDEITFGTLIFDKQCSEMLCEELLRIKRDGSININVIKDILEKGCFTDTELDTARNEFEDIKQDIFKFKQLLTVKNKFESWYDRTASTGAYIIGSQSWYQHYIALKMTAADMYFKLISSGEQFNQQAKAAYEKRYGEILRESSEKERTELALRRQFDENVANGIPNAREIYCEAMMVAGLMTEEQVEAQNKLFKAAGSSEVESGKEPSVPKLIEQDNTDEMSQPLHSMGTSVDSEEDIEPLTADSLIDLFKKTENITDVMERALIIVDIAKIAIHTLMYADIFCPGRWDDAINEFVKGTGTADSMVELSETLITVISVSANSNIINSCALEYKDGEYATLLRKINELQSK